MHETPSDVERDEPVPASATAAERLPVDPHPRATSPLRRRADGRIIAGVAGGLADRWALPVWLIRVPFGFAAFIDAMLVWRAFGSPSVRGILGISTRIALFGLAGLAFYLLLWWFVPREDVGVSPAHRGARLLFSPIRSFSRTYPGVRSWPGLALLAVGGALLLNQLGIWDPIVAFAFGSIGIGLMLYRRGPVDVERAAPPPDAPVPPDRAPTSWQPSAARPSRERSPFGWIVFGSALLVGSVAAVMLQVRAGDNVFSPDGLVDRLSTPPALALLTLGIGLLISSVFGRARWNVLPASLLVPVMLIASTIRLPLAGRYGDTVANVHPYNEVVSFHSAAGKIYANYVSFRGRGDIDRFPISDTTVVGDVSIGLPYDASYRVVAYTGLGEVAIGRGTTGSGVEISRSYHYRSPITGGPSFVIHAETGIGNVDVYRVIENRREARELREAARATP
jgi:phage shock protein PspC (stress-responsive transcriptional regulator)